MRINFFRNRIQLLDPSSQTINIVQISSKWNDIIGLYPIVGNVFHALSQNDRRNLLVSRYDVFNTGNLDQRIIKALIWGYPYGMQGTRNLQSIMAHLHQIIQIVNEYNSGPLTKERFLSAYRTLSCISGLKQSTLSKILYFCNVSVGSNRAVIVDANVIEAFGFFDDYYDASFESDPAERYFRQIVRINSSACRLNVTPDQIEYFLFELGKQGKRVKTDFVTNY